MWVGGGLGVSTTICFWARKTVVQAPTLSTELSCSLHQLLHPLPATTPVPGLLFPEAVSPAGMRALLSAQAGPCSGHYKIFVKVMHE